MSDFIPSINGFHFANWFESAPVVELDLGILGKAGIGDSSGGLCGGMVFCAIALFNSGELPPSMTESPKSGTDLFTKLCNRLIDSFGGIKGIYKYLTWMRYGDSDLMWMKSIAWHTLYGEWSGIEQEINKIGVCPIAVIKVESLNPLELGKNHQVLAYGYSFVDSELIVNIYDPNYPDDNTVTLNLKSIYMPQLGKLTHSKGDFVRGFFKTNYV